MLGGPAQPNGHHQHHQSNLRANVTDSVHDGQGAFDSTTFRTGFTPGGGTGFTPGYTSLMGAAGYGSLPLPSPNTTAFLNMVTNSTPLGEGGEASANLSTGGAPHHPSALPPHMQQHHELSHTGHPDMGQDTITPNTLSALTGVYNDMNRGPSGPHPSQPPFFPQQPPMHPGGPHASMPPQPLQQPPVDYAQQSANAASQAANGLFLLSQAHHELSKREEAEGRHGAPLMAKKTSIGAVPPGSGRPPVGSNGPIAGVPVPGLNGSTNGNGTVNGGTNSHKRKSDPAVIKPPTSKKGKKNTGATAPTPAATIAALMTPPKSGGVGGVGAGSAGGVKEENQSASPNFSIQSDDDFLEKMEGGDGDGFGGGSRGPETEEDKRKNFLERNRQGEWVVDKMVASVLSAWLLSDILPVNCLTPAPFLTLSTYALSNPVTCVTRAASALPLFAHPPFQSCRPLLRRSTPSLTNVTTTTTAALKCRQRKKAWLGELQTKVEQMAMENDRLNQTIQGLHDELARLNSILMQHRDCGLGQPGYGRPIR